MSKRCGNAVQRNLSRRRLRAAVDQGSFEIAPGAYLIRTDPAAKTLGFSEISEFLREAMMKAATQGKESRDGE